MADVPDINDYSEEDILKLYEDIVETPEQIYLAKYCSPVYGTGGSSNTTVGYRCS